MTGLKRHTYVTCTLNKRKECSGAVAPTLFTLCERICLLHLFFLCVREIGMLRCLASLFRARFVPAFAFWGRGRGALRWSWRFPRRVDLGALRCCGGFPCKLDFGIRLCFGIPANILRYFPLPWHVVSMKALGRMVESSYTHAFYIITKTCLYNFDPLKPHFYIVKLGFTGVYIIFLISAQNIDCGYSLEPPLRGGSNEYPQSMF